jgi:hypothetical protein
MSKTTVLLRRAPLSLTSVFALIARGNLLSFLPPNVDCCSNEETRRTLGRSGKVIIWLGWGDLADIDGMTTGQENESRISCLFYSLLHESMVEEAKLRAKKSQIGKSE